MRTNHNKLAIEAEADRLAGVYLRVVMLAQARRIEYDLAAGKSTATELLFQLQFSIGAHGAHPF